MKKKIHNIHDKSYKSLYSKKEIAIDLFKTFINESITKDLKMEDITLVNKSFISADFEESESDIIYTANIDGSEVIFYILLEFQSTVDYRMPLRLLFYVSEILRDYAKNNKILKNDKNIKIPAVVPIVLYNGEQKWDAKTEFRDMYYGEEDFPQEILNFKYELIDVNNNFTKEQLLENKSVTSAIFLLDQKINPFEFLGRITDIALFFNSLTDEQLKAIKSWIRNTIEEKLAKQATEILDMNKEEVSTMVASNAFILTEAMESKWIEGKLEGRLEGRLEGKLESKREDIIELLEEIGAVTYSIKEKINKIEDIDKLKSLLKLASRAESIEEFNQKLS